MSLEQFRLTQEQFFFAVSFFPRPMSVLVGRIPDPKQRLDILHNVVEEHGEFDEKAFHHTTFQQFLSTIGTDPWWAECTPAEALVAPGPRVTRHTPGRPVRRP